MKLFYTDHFDLPLPDGHRFPMDKYRLLRERLAEQAKTGERDWQLLVPEAANDDNLLLAHTAEYLRRIVTGDLTDTDVRRIGFPWSPELVVRSRYSTGATICAARAALTDDVSANLAGGTHHAFAETAAGYCVFNDAVVAARVLQSKGSLQRVLIVDCDVHQGNGSADIVKDDDSIFTLSIHGEKNYPFRKADSDLDIALPDRTGDEAYLDALQTALATTRQSVTPDLIIYIAGADPFIGDRLGRLSITKDGLAARDRIVFEHAAKSRIPVAIAMGGGYANELGDIVDIHARTIDEAYRVFRE